MSHNVNHIFIIELIGRPQNDPVAYLRRRITVVLIRNCRLTSMVKCKKKQPDDLEFENWIWIGSESMRLFRSERITLVQKDKQSIESAKFSGSDQDHPNVLVFWVKFPLKYVRNYGRNASMDHLSVMSHSFGRLFVVQTLHGRSLGNAMRISWCRNPQDLAKRMAY